MLNYANLNDVEFEYLCKDIMQAKLNRVLHSFARGRDGGIDLCDNVETKNIIIQAKHYVNTPTTEAVRKIKEELKKVKKINPKQYYVCISRSLTPNNVKEIYDCFSSYMDSPDNIITREEIEDFLTDPQNHNILVRHYKLWIESTGILQDIISNDQFIDCEVLLSTIEKDKKYFVRTQAYEEALTCLRRNKTLFIVGNPGVGKTTTSKMLVLHFATEGYQVRYTTSATNLNELKKSISRDSETKEIILIDDCLGQAYFKMKETQSNELLSLIKYVSLSKNKLLILNSRITIYNEALSHNREMLKSVSEGEFSKYILDMNNLPSFDKGRIFYNHLYFNNIGEAYYEDIRKEKRYLKVINHPNYNPRIIEFVSDPRHIGKITATEFFEFILKTLENPTEIWRDEYENNLQIPDRALLLILYSISDKAVPEAQVKRAFEKWVKNDSYYDKTVSQYEISLRRLMDGFILKIEKSGEPYLMITNPSLNDYFDSYISSHPEVKAEIIKKACFIEQDRRVMDREEFDQWLIESLENHSIGNYEFMQPSDKAAFISNAIMINCICDRYYQDTVLNYLMNPQSYYRESLGVILSVNVLKGFLGNNKLKDFYNIDSIILDIEKFDEFVDSLSLDELLAVIPLIESIINEDDYEYYSFVIQTALESAVEFYCDYIYADQYDPDVQLAISHATRQAYDDIYVDEDDAVRYIEEEVGELVRLEIKEKLKDISKVLKIDDSFLDNVPVEVTGADDLLFNYLSYEGEDYSIEKTPFSEKELINMFEREYNNNYA